MPGLINGPLWGRYIGAIQVCEERWQDKFLLKDNLHLPQPWEWCASWTWYIDVDFQVYPFIVLITYVFIQNRFLKKVAYLVILGLTYYSAQTGLEIIHKSKNPYWDWYGSPSSRASEILVGAIFGLQYYEYAKLKLKSNFVALCEKYCALRYLCIVVGAYINYYAIFIPWNLTGIWSANEWFYIKRLYISIGTGLLFVPLANDAPSILKSFMNLRVFQILGKLCFGAYLLHWPLQLAVNYTSEQILDFYDHYVLMDKIKRSIIHSFTAAFVYYLVLEKPLLNIEAYFTKRQKSPSNPTENTKTAPSTFEFKVLSETTTHETSIADQSCKQDSVLEGSIMNENRVIESSIPPYYYAKKSQ
jgi:peptidoglycan/LPS O-acetylase OafA/YrhL